MKRLLILPLLFSLVACAGVTPQQTATNTLLTIHDTIVNIESGIKVPCASGVIPASDCAAISNYILQAKPAYNDAVDAEVVWLDSTNTGKASDQGNYIAKRQSLDILVGDAVALALKYGVKGSK